MPKPRIDPTSGISSEDYTLNPGRENTEARRQLGPGPTGPRNNQAYPGSQRKAPVGSAAIALIEAEETIARLVKLDPGNPVLPSRLAAASPFFEQGQTLGQ